MGTTTNLINKRVSDNLMLESLSHPNSRLFVTLTDYQVMFENQSSKKKIVELENLVSLEVKYEGDKRNVFAGFILFIIGYIGSVIANDTFLFMGILASVPFFLLYFCNGKHYLMVTSRDDFFCLDAKGIPLRQLLDFADLVEEKSYLLKQRDLNETN